MAELEEGEAPMFDYGGSKTFDIDKDLSYIDEKLQNALGRFQKDFEEGGCYSQGLGATYGGYGTFLPTYQRSPKPKSPQKVQTPSSVKYPTLLHREGTAASIATQGTPQKANAVANVLSQRNGNATVSSEKTPQKANAVTHVPCQRNGNATVSSAKTPTPAPVANVPWSQRNGSATVGSESATAKVVDKIHKSHQQATNKSDVPDDQKLLKVRIKFGSEKTPQKNTAIYSGLGLMSPSTSAGNSLGDNEGYKTPDVSLPSILQMLTSVVAAGDLLVSPLDDSFLRLKESKPSSKIKLKHSLSSTSADEFVSHSRHENALNRKHSQAKMRETHKVSKCSDGKGCEDDIQLRLKENSGAQMLVRPSNSIANASELNSVKAVETSQEYNNDALSNKKTAKITMSKMKGRILGNISVKDESLESISGKSSGKSDHREAVAKKQHAINYQKDMATDHGESKRNNANTNLAPFRVDTDVLKAEKDGKVDTSHFIPKRSLKAASSEQNEVRPHATAKKSSSAGKKNLKDSSVKDSSLYSAQGSRSGGVLVASKESVMKSNAQEALGDCLGDRAKESMYDRVKENKGLGRMKEKLTSTKFENQVTTGTVVQDPPSGILPSNTRETLGGEQATAAPILIEEHWVCCDKCEKWRLLPYGILPEHLPEKWLCRMLDWLPDMNKCYISEDETTKALRALNQLPLPQSHAIGVPAVDQQQSFSLSSIDAGKKEAYKGKVIVGPVRRAKNSQQDMMNRGSSNDRKPYVGGSKPSDKLNSQRFSKPGIPVKSLPGGEAMAKKKVKRESDQDDRGIQKRIKSEGTFDIDNFQTLTSNRGRLANQKPCENDRSQQLMVDDKSGVLTSAREDVSGLPSKKRKLKEWLTQSGTLGVDGSHIVSVKEESSDSGFVRDKKPRVSRSDGKESGSSKSTAELKSKDMKSRMIPAVPKNITDGNLGISKQQDKIRVKNMSGVTLEDLESLKKSLGCEPGSTAVTSSSSKVSSSRKTRSNYQELKGSPIGSVSSSPLRMSKLKKLSPIISGFDNAKVANFSTEKSSRKVMTGDVNLDAKKPVMAKQRNSSDKLKAEHTDLVVSNSAVKRESRKFLDVTREDHVQPVEKEGLSLKLGDSCNKDAYAPLQHGLVNISTQEDSRKEISNVDRDFKYEHKVHPFGIKLAPATQFGGLLQEQAHDVSSCNDVPKVSRDLGHAPTQSASCPMMDNSALDPPLLRDLGGPGQLRKDASSQTIHAILKEAEAQRAFADQIKGTGFDHECNETYFQASLKFLHGASLLESNSEKNKSGELNQLQIYISTAKNFETCAHEYERQKELALAALAYKCVEVAYMRVVYCKSSSSGRHWHDMQTSLQSVPLGESPSSSASDIDNLNNQGVVEKPPLSKGNGSLSASHAIAPRNRPNFIRLLDFTKDVNLAMEASRKARNAFEAASLILEDPSHKEAIVAVKRAIDFSFQDVEEFLRLVRVAVESVESSGRRGITLQ